MHQIVHFRIKDLNQRSVDETQCRDLKLSHMSHASSVLSIYFRIQNYLILAKCISIAFPFGKFSIIRSINRQKQL